MSSYNMKDYFNPTPRQMEAYKHVGKGGRIFFGGARGGGKSFMAEGTAVSCADQFKGIEIVMVRKTHPELLSVFINPMRKDFPPEVFKYKYVKQDKTAYFQNGSEIIFKACETESDAEKLQGIQYQLMIIDEANQFDEMTLAKMTGSARKSKKQVSLKNFKSTILMTGNPGGRADLYFKTRYIQPDYSYWRPEELLMKDKYVFIPAKVSDNPYIEEDYILWLGSLPDGLRRAWRDGDWDTFQGQFFTEWNPEVHIVEDFEIPKHWLRSCGLDIGYSVSHPTVCLWTAQDPETQDVYVYKEYTGMTSSDGGCDAKYAADIKALSSQENVSVYWADPSAFSGGIKHEHTSESTSFYFLREGVFLSRADNDRINGWRTVKQWLNWSEDKAPKLKVFRSCYRTSQAIPTMRYNNRTIIHTEDMDTTQSQDDYADALRYVIHNAYFYPGPQYMQDHILPAQFKGKSKSMTLTMAEKEILTNSFLSTDRNAEPNIFEKKYEEEKKMVYLQPRAIF